MYQLQLPGAEVANDPLTIAVGIAESDETCPLKITSTVCC